MSTWARLLTKQTKRKYNASVGLTVSDSSNTLISFPVRKRKIRTFLSEAIVAIFFPSGENARQVG